MKGCDLYYRSFLVLFGLLKNDDLGVRIVVGEVIVLFYELIDMLLFIEEDVEDFVDDEILLILIVSKFFFWVVL